MDWIAFTFRSSVISNLYAFLWELTRLDHGFPYEKTLKDGGGLIERVAIKSFDLGLDT